MVHCPTRHYNPSPGLCGELCCFTGKKNTRKFGEYLLLVDNCALELPINFYQSYFPQVLITTRTLKTINNEFILHFSLANFIGVFFTWQFGKLYGICVAFVWSLR